MKNNFIITIALFFTMCILHGCHFVEECDPSLNDEYLIQFEDLDYQLHNNGAEVDVNFEIRSDFTDDACLILKVVKEFSRENPKRYEGFKDSLKIDDFDVRSYAITESGQIITGLNTPVDFPIFVKEFFINKGKNSVSFKIIFPKNIALYEGNVYVDIFATKFNIEIKSSLNDIKSFYQSHPYFEFFPDSSGISFAFSDPYIITNETTTHETYEVGRRCPKHVMYYTCFFRRLFLTSK